MILYRVSCGGTRIINSDVPIDALVEAFNNDPRSKKIVDKCAFLEIVFSWVDNWKEKNNSCINYES